MSEAAPRRDPSPRGRLVRVTLAGGGTGLSALMLAEREQAIADLQSEAVFSPAGSPPSEDSWALRLAVEQGRLIFDIRRPDDSRAVLHALALGPFRSILKDYDLLVASHVAAFEAGREERIQAIDMGRRGLHDEAARLVTARLAGKIAIDFATARRLFTLIYVLHQRD